MGNEITKVSKARIIKNGIDQEYYITNNFEILLSTIQKDTVLDRHNHPHIQFGYCLHGYFNFKSGNKNHLIKGGMSYLLSSNIYHSADALVTFYALDYKYLLNNINKPKKDIQICLFANEIHQGGLIITSVFLANTKIIKIKSYNTISSEFKLETNKGDLKEYYLISSKKIELNVNNEKIIIEPMNIYKFNHTNNTIQLKEINKEILILQIAE